MTVKFSHPLTSSSLSSPELGVSMCMLVTFCKKSIFLRAYVLTCPACAQRGDAFYGSSRIVPRTSWSLPWLVSKRHRWSADGLFCCLVYERHGENRVSRGGSHRIERNTELPYRLPNLLWLCVCWLQLLQLLSACYGRSILLGLYGLLVGVSLDPYTALTTFWSSIGTP